VRLMLPAFNPIRGGPQPLENQRTKGQKTDRLDARALLTNLESYLRGNRDAMSIVAVPSRKWNSNNRAIRLRSRSLVRGSFHKRGKSSAKALLVLLELLPADIAGMGVFDQDWPLLTRQADRFLQHSPID
jgi:hypothetical protein